MKKIGIIFVFLFTTFFFVGCGNMSNTPTKRVEEFLGKYQSLDSDVLTQLDSVIATDKTMSDEQKETYRAALEKQYQNLSYKIKDENIEGDTATVDVEIEVLDYATAIDLAKEYYQEHKDEIDNKEDGEKKDDNSLKDNDSLVEDAKDLVEGTTDAIEEAFDDTKAFIDYKLKQIENVNDKTKYTITFYLEKEDGKWEMKDISDEDRQKLHGLY